MIEQIKNFFGFKHIPFSKVIGTRDLFVSKSIKEALSQLAVAIENEDMAMLTGFAGSGKTCVVRKFTSELDTDMYRRIYIAADHMKPGEIAKQILSGLNSKVPFQSTVAIRRLKKTVMEMDRTRGIKPLVVIDEAQELSPETLSSLKSFINFNMDSANLMFLLLCGQPELIDKLRLNQLESLNRRIRLRYALTGLELEETIRYVNHQMELAGKKSAVFADEAIAEVHKISKGNISAVNKICFDLIIMAVADRKELIDSSMVKEAAGNR